MAPGDIVRLIVSSPSHGDKKLVYEAGHQFRVRRLVTELPVAVGDTRTTPVAPHVEVVALSADRSRLLFPVCDVERVPGGETCEF